MAPALFSFRDISGISVASPSELIEQQLGAENIRGAIAQNNKMDTALEQFGYGTDDVVGRVVGRTQAVL